MASSTYNPQGGTRAAFDSLFQLQAKLDNTNKAVAQINADLASYDIDRLKDRLTALEERVAKLEGGGTGA